MDVKDIYVDGGTRGNAICLVDKSEDVYIVKRRKGKPSNNELEYLAIIYCLEYLMQKGLKHCNVYSDSRLIVKQLNGSWSINNENLKRLNETALLKLSRCCGIKIKWIPREKNLAGIHLEKIKNYLKYSS